jgi:conjugal transfer pilus assembly protein TrbC
VWATDRATLIGRALGAEVAALLLAGSVLGAPATPPAVTEADIERARQQHRMSTEAEMARVPVPAAPRIDNLPQPVTSMPIDLEAISKGFDVQNGSQAAAMTPGKAGPKVLIFVSFAMPEPTLQRLVDQAARAGATIVLRGLVNGSIRDTVTRMQALIDSRRVAVQIDPEAFDRYGITYRGRGMYIPRVWLVAAVCEGRWRCDPGLCDAVPESALAGFSSAEAVDAAPPSARVQSRQRPDSGRSGRVEHDLLTTHCGNSVP